MRKFVKTASEYFEEIGKANAKTLAEMASQGSVSPADAMESIYGMVGRRPINEEIGHILGTVKPDEIFKTLGMAATGEEAFLKILETAHARGIVVSDVAGIGAYTAGLFWTVEHEEGDEEK